ncbi:MAG: primosomal protein N', partial [Eubacterium sp.]|nr:primosomal protein N' [Eubacterium sp.]
MSQRIAEVIVDILSSSLDRPFDYLIPDEIADVIREGSPVVIPFGRADKEITGYVIKIKDTTEYDITRLKSIADIHHGEVPVEGQLLSLAAWIKEHYGSTMSEAIKTVLPVRSRIKSVEEHWLNLIISPDEAYDLADEEEKKHHTARARLLRALAASAPITLSAARKKYKTTGQVIDTLCAVGAISVTDVCMERRPEELSSDTRDEISYIPNEEQKNAIDTITRDIDAGDMNTYLLYGVTGSGKTFVYIEII